MLVVQIHRLCDLKQIERYQEFFSVGLGLTCDGSLL